MSDFSDVVQNIRSRGECLLFINIIACQKPIYSTIKYITNQIISNMNLQMESLLEDMQVNWSIIK